MEETEYFTECCPAQATRFERVLLFGALREEGVSC